MGTCLENTHCDHWACQPRFYMLQGYIMAASPSVHSSTPQQMHRSGQHMVKTHVRKEAISYIACTNGPSSLLYRHRVAGREQAPSEALRKLDQSSVEQKLIMSSGLPGLLLPVLQLGLLQQRHSSLRLMCSRCRRLQKQPAPCQ